MTTRFKPADRVALIDLGTNTFHLFIVEIDTDGQFAQLYKEKIGVKIGEGCINEGYISDEGRQRALATLQDFRAKIDELHVPLEHTFATATSAIRQAKNGTEIVEEIKTKTGISVNVIDGNREAELIYYGVRAAVQLGDSSSLIMDIGGGSVEFIIGNANEIFWKQSFEVGGQRLRDRFMDTDPISLQAVQAIREYLDSELKPLAQAIEKYQPQTLVGSSGTFDTLCDIYQRQMGLAEGNAIIENATEFKLPVKIFLQIYKEIITKNHSERLAIQGMIPLRVDMIVVAVCLIHYVIFNYKIKDIHVSTYSLKEGLLYHLLGTQA